MNNSLPVNNSLPARWLPLLGLLLFTVLALNLVRPPRPVPPSAPATTFSAERARREVAIIAREPHSIGTAAHGRVRDYLLRRCRALGLQARVQDTTVVTGEGGYLTGARVQNVVARLPGRVPGGRAVLVLSHYDSQPHTPGAGDDGAGVAAALETMRALRAGPALPHDVVWVFTDGEEAGLLGAYAYAADTARLRREVGVVLNFEGRGNSGESMLFEMSTGNGWVLGEFARAAPVPVGSSLAYEIYRNLPNDTDFTAFRAAGLPGLNFAFLNGYSYYHSPADTPERLDLSSLQHHGDNMLPLVRHFASIPLAGAPSPDSTFFNPLGTWLVRYDARWNYLLDAVAGLLLLAAVGRARRQGRLRLRGLPAGALVWLGGLVLVLLAGWALTQLLPAVYPQYAVFYDHAFYNVRLYHLALVALGTAVFAGWYGVARRWLRPDSLTGGVLLALAGLQALVQLKAPTSAFLLGFPLLFGALAWRWSLRTSAPAAGGPAAGAAGRQSAVAALPWPGGLLLLPAVALLAPNISVLLVVAGLGPLVPAGLLLLAVLLGLLLPALLPTLARPTRLAGGVTATTAAAATAAAAAAAGSARRPGNWALPLLATAVAAGALIAGHFSSRPTVEFPRQTHAYYLLDTEQPRALWLSSQPRADAFTKQFFTAPAFKPLPELFPGAMLPVLHQTAPRLPLAPPTVAVLADSALAPGGRRLRLLVRAGRPEVVSLKLSWAAPLQRLRVAGHELPPGRFQRKAKGDAKDRTPATSLIFLAAGPAGVVLELETAARPPFELTVTDCSLGLPPIVGIRPLAPDMVRAPGYNSFTTQVRKRFQL